MTNFRINYSHPWLLLLIIPAILLTLWPYLRINKKYRRTRNRVISVTLHIIAMVLAVNLLAGITFSYEIPNKENEVILLVDVSDSNGEELEKKNEFVQTVLNICDNAYRVGIVKFGYDQKYVAPLSEESMQVYEQYLTSEDPDTTATDLASALKYTATLFQNPRSAKIVVISDGMETDNAAVSVIKAIAAEGIKVDTVHFPNAAHEELQIVGIEIPEQQIRPGEPFATELLLHGNFTSEGQTVQLNLYDNDVLLGSAAVPVNKEKQSVSVDLTLETRGMHELRYEIVASSGDHLAQNNSYRTYVNLQVFENILLIERYEKESEKLQKMLQDTYKVVAYSIEEDLAEIPKDLRELAEYEQVILCNIAFADMPAGFEGLLNQYVYDLGGGLFTVGGRNEIVDGKLIPHAYNRADLANSTYYKQMLPINAVDYTPPIAVMLVIDTSASMSMGKLAAAVEGAEACLDTLSDRDFCGVMSFATRSGEALEVLPVSQREVILEAIRGIGYDESGQGGTIFSDAIQKAGRALSVINNVERRHIIMVTDGNPGDTYETYLPYIEDNMEDGITMSIVTVGDIDSGLREKMTDTANAGGGKFYNVQQNELQTIPAVMQQDLALEAIAEIAYGEEFQPRIKDLTVVVKNVNQTDIPMLTGYYGTVKKEGAVVPLMGKYVPIYAQWKYGAGNVGSFLCDLNGEWSASFVESEVGVTIVRNIVDNLFPAQDVRADNLAYAIKTDNYTTQVNVHGVAENHKLQLFVTPVAEALKLTVGESVPVRIAEENKRYVFVIKTPGLYEVKLLEQDELGQTVAEVVTYQVFSYSEEYNAFPDRAPIGEELMTLLATDGKGIVISDPAEVFWNFAKTLKEEVDPRIVLLILVIVLMLLDIAVRKFKFKWPHELVREYKRKKADAARKE
ncbi:MAG: VWA domain-containing protein [Ruminococcaceae bacterium]|nr:VWA domain-containing protein [Oscillospiraceae bacterium]